MKLFNHNGLEYHFYWENLITVLINIKIGKQLAGNSVELALKYPRIYKYKIANSSYPIQESDDPDDYPF